MQKTKEVQHLTIEPSQSGRRIDNFLQYQLKGVPKSRIYQMIRKGEVRVNGSRVKQNHRIESNDIVRIPPVSLPDKCAKQHYFNQQLIDCLQAATLFEDDNLLVINKPAGLVVHAGTGEQTGIIEYLRHIRTELDYLELAHRLDRDTSGCLILAKSPIVLKEIHVSLNEKTAHKHYLTFVKGEWPKKLTEISKPLKKNTLSSGERLVRVDTDGKMAITRFQCQKVYQHGTLLDVELLTGRTHQIRVHACSEGHPIVMDHKYGDTEYNKQMKRLGLKRLFLHASEIRLNIPSYRHTFAVKAPLPDDLQTFLSKL